MRIQVALDGVPASGKTTAAHLLGEKMRAEFCSKHKGMIALSGGIFYRAIGRDANEKKIRVNDIIPLIASARATCKRLVNLFEDEVAWRAYEETLKDEETGSLASHVSPLHSIRQLVNNAILGIAENTPCFVCDGQDGHAVLTENPILFFLTAPLEKRAEWRHKQVGGDIEEITKAIRDRDNRDRTRAISPLIQHENALLVDGSTFPGPQEVANFLFEKCLDHLGHSRR